MEGLEMVFLVRGHCHPQAVTTSLYVLLDVTISETHPIPEQLPAPLTGDPCFLTPCPQNTALPSQSAAAPCRW